MQTLYSESKNLGGLSLMSPTVILTNVKPVLPPLSVAVTGTS